MFYLCRHYAFDLCMQSVKGRSGNVLNIDLFPIAIYYSVYQIPLLTRYRVIGFSKIPSRIRLVESRVKKVKIIHKECSIKNGK